MEEKILKQLEGSASEDEKKVIESWVRESGENKKALEDYSKIFSASENAFESVYFDENKAFERFKASLNTDTEIETEIVESKESHIDRSAILKIAAAIALLAGVFFTYNFFLGSTQFTAEVNGEEVILPDDSKVWLKKGSSISYKTYFSSRKVLLTGEAFFDVTERGDNFIVVTGDTETEVLGTEFLLRTEENKQTTLVVVSGKVAFSSGDQSSEKVLLTENQQAIYDVSEGVRKSNEPVNSNDFAWKTHVLNYDETPLTEVIEDLSQLHEVDILISTENINDCNFSGTFEKLSLEESVEILAYSMHLDFTTDSEILEVSGEGCK